MATRMEPGSSTPAWRRISAPDLVMMVVLLGFCVWAIFQARAWPFRAALFPVGTAIFVAVIILIKLAVMVRDARTPSSDTSPLVGRAVLPGTEPTLIEEDLVADAEAEDVFKTATRAMWTPALAWLGGFFLLAWVAGMMVAIPLFALAYLLVESRERPVVAVTYAVISALVIYGIFDQLLHIPLPQSILLSITAQ